MKSAMRALFVAEKNDAAKGIAAILSRGTSTRRESRSKWNKIYQFTADLLNQRNCHVVLTSVAGHLLQHQFPATHKNWRETPMRTLFEVPLQKGVIPGMEDIKTTLLEEARQCDVLVIWTDCDREGEDIGAEVVSVCQEVKPRVDVFRARFSEITQTAIWRALNNLARLDQRLVDAVECRSELDLRIGAAFTRLQTLHLREKFATVFREQQEVISYGSCQFPTLGFVVERYKAIKEFVAEPFWKLEVSHKRDDVNVEFSWNRGRLFDQNVVQVFMDICEEAKEGRITAVTSKPKSRWRPVALDTVELEKLAVRKLRISAKDAMAVAEKLYTKGYISYPRTETNKFPSNLDLRPFVEQQTANGDWGGFAQEVCNNGLNPRNGTKSDEAHPPIHPLKFASHSDLVGLEWAVYELVVRHFLACVSSDAHGKETTANLSVASEEFTATGLVIEDLGFLKVYKYDKWNDKTLPPYREGEVLTDYHVDMNEGNTQPPQLLNEADLIALMDKYGIGTDATHADHIEKIKQRQYATLNADNRFVPGYLGLALVDGYDRMGFAMSKPHLRADLESQLKLICRGERNHEEVLREQITKYKRIFEQTEDKIIMISNAFREYLNMREREPPNDGAGDVINNNWNNNTGRTGPAPTPTSQRGRNRSTSSRGRGTRATKTVPRNNPSQRVEQASTNMSDIDLLESLSILNTGRRRSRGRGGNAGAGGSTTNAPFANQPNLQDGNQKICKCRVPAVRFQVRKEGANKGRYFFVCSKDRADPARCDFFEWDNSANM